MSRECAPTGNSPGYIGGRIGWALFPTSEEANILKNLKIAAASIIKPPKILQTPLKASRDHLLKT
jgi:hypothetical protein